MFLILKPTIHMYVIIKTCLATWFYSLLLLSGDVELNPGPKLNYSYAFSICHWNLNSISAHNYAQMFVFKAYIAIHKFDNICISEIYLDSSTSSYDSNLKISGHTLVRPDHPSNNNRGVICIYYKSYLTLRILNVQYLQNSICFELNIGDKTCNFLSFYRSPSQSQDGFESFTENLQLDLENLVQMNAFLFVAIRDFNAKLSNWFCHDKTNFEGDAI